MAAIDSAVLATLFPPRPPPESSPDRPRSTFPQSTEERAKGSPSRLLPRDPRVRSTSGLRRRASPARPAFCCPRPVFPFSFSVHAISSSLSVLISPRHEISLLHFLISGFRRRFSLSHFRFSTFPFPQPNITLSNRYKSRLENRVSLSTSYTYTISNRYKK